MIGHSHHRNSTDCINDILIINIVLDTTEKELKVGTSIMDGRKSLLLINDSSCLVYVSYLPTFTIGGSDNYTLYSGAVLELCVDPNPPDGVEPKRFYAKTEEGSTTIKLVEVK